MSEMGNAAEWVAIAELVPWGDNPRDNDEAAAKVAESIRRFGWGAPIVARAEDRMVIAGHTRLKAAALLGLDRVPVRFVDLSPVDARLLALADNRVGEIAEWSDGLGDVLRALDEQGAELDGLGWDADGLAELLEPDPPADEEAIEPRDLDVIPVEVEAVTKAGDVAEVGRQVLRCGDCIEELRAMDESSVDAIVTDPPYGIGFMGKGWDCSVPGEDFAREALRVLKPGGHLIAFAATRTVHRLAVALEDAGFEIRDQIAWLQWQGFPKSLDVSKAIDSAAGAEREVIGFKKVVPGVAFSSEGPDEMPVTLPATEAAQLWEGWGTALKPAFEPAILVRKPLEGTVAANVIKWGTGAINVDACRYAYGDPAWPGPQSENPKGSGNDLGYHGGGSGTGGNRTPDLGRWPANIYHCPKPSRGERERGCERLQARTGAEAVEREEGAAGLNSPRAGAGRTASGVRNYHPTVKPVALMRWLLRLVTPPGGVVVEPFAGSGTTLVAAEVEGITCVGIERDPAYCDIILARVGGVVDEPR